MQKENENEVIDGGQIVLRVRQVPKLLGVGLTKVNQWIKEGVIPTYESPDGGIVWIKPEDLESFKKSLSPKTNHNWN